MGTMCVLNRTRCLTLKGWKWGYCIWIFKKEGGAMSVAIAMAQWVSFFFGMCISVFFLCILLHIEGQQCSITVLSRIIMTTGDFR